MLPSDIHEQEAIQSLGKMRHTNVLSKLSLFVMWLGKDKTKNCLPALMDIVGSRAH